MNRNCLIAQAGNEVQFMTLTNSLTKTAGVSPQVMFQNYIFERLELFQANKTRSEQKAKEDDR